MSNFNSQFLGRGNRGNVEQLIVPKDALSHAPGWRHDPCNSSRVKGAISDLRATAKPFGYSAQEWKRASEGRHYLEELGLPINYAVLSDERLASGLQTPHGAQKLYQTFRNHLSTYQQQAGMTPVWLVMVETDPWLHWNCLFPTPPGKMGERICNKLEKSNIYHKPILDLQRNVDPPTQWFLGYCAKEAMTEAHFVYGWKHGKSIGAREKGSSFPMAGLGDRVLIAAGMKDDLIQTRRIKPYRETYSKFAKPSGAVITGEIQAAPVIEALPVPASPLIASPIRNGQQPISTPVQLEIAFDAPVIDIRGRIEAKRLACDMTQAAVAALLGMKQPGYCNAIVRRHDPLGAWARARGLEWLAAA
ncbi:MAG: hypothetical protein ACLPSW_00815 [Roseiarcus sp.]